MSAPEIIYPPAVGGGTPVGGSGTTNTIPRWNPGPSTLGDSVITQDGTSIGVRQATPSAYLFNSVVVGDPALGNAGITVASGIANDGTFAFADGTVGNAAYRGYIQYKHATDTMQIGTAASPQITILSTGFVGIGTASPGSRLDVANAGNVIVRAQNTASNSDAQFNAVNTFGTATFGINNVGGYALTASAIPFLFYTNNTERARIDSAGNLSIGYTGGSWSSTYTGMFLNRGLSFMARDGGDTYISANAIYDSSNAWKYVASGSTASTQIAFQSGVTVFRRAVAGTAGSALTWLESARIDSAGRLQVGASNAAGAAANTALLLRNPATTNSPAELLLQNGYTLPGVNSGLGTLKFQDASGNTYAQIAAQVDAADGANDFPGRLVFSTVPDGSNVVTERVRIDSSGNVGIGTATPLSYANYVSLTIGGNDAAKTGILKFRSTYNGGNGAEIFQSAAGVLAISANGSRSIMSAQNTGGTDSAAQVAIGTGSFTSGCSLTVAQSIDASQSAQGLKLPATPGNADTQTLDAYRENTFTPTIQGGTTAGVGTYTSQVGTFTIIGRCLFFNVEIAWSAHTGTGVVQLAGLPVAAAQLATFGIDSNYAAAGYLRMSAGNTYAQINTINVPATGNYRVSGCYFIV